MTTSKGAIVDRKHTWHPLAIVCLFRGHAYEWEASDFDVVAVCTRCKHVTW